jgi:myosin heavy subunit
MDSSIILFYHFFKNSLEVLMKRMSESKPLFLRCIKPNSHKLANNFDDKFVKLQVMSKITK